MGPRMSPSQFRRLVLQAVASLPPPVKAALENVDIVVRWRPTRWERRQAGVAPGEPLLGLYLGVPRHRRGAEYTLAVPDRIVIYQEPHERLAHTREELVQQLRTTILHEVGHYLGLDEEHLSELGLD